MFWSENQLIKPTTSDGQPIPWYANSLICDGMTLITKCKGLMHSQETRQFIADTSFEKNGHRNKGIQINDCIFIYISIHIHILHSIRGTHDSGVRLGPVGQFLLFILQVSYFEHFVPNFDGFLLLCKGGPYIINIHISSEAYPILFVHMNYRAKLVLITHHHEKEE